MACLWKVSFALPSKVLSCPCLRASILSLFVLAQEIEQKVPSLWLHGTKKLLEHDKFSHILLTLRQVGDSLTIVNPQGSFSMSSYNLVISRFLSSVMVCLDLSRCSAVQAKQNFLR